MKTIDIKAITDERVSAPLPQLSQTLNPFIDVPEDVISKLEIFFGQYQLRKYSKGQIFLFPDEGADNVYYLESGNVRMYDISSHGNEVVVGVFKPYTLFPLGIVFTQTPNYYFFEASTAISIRKAPVEETMDFIRQNGDVAFDLLTESYIIVESNRRRMAHLMAGSADNRLLYELIIQAHRFGQLGPNGCLIRVSETEIGARSGLSRETVSRKIGELKQLDLISITRGGIVISDVRALEAMLGVNL